MAERTGRQKARAGKASEPNVARTSGPARVTLQAESGARQALHEVGMPCASMPSARAPQKASATFPAAGRLQRDSDLCPDQALFRFLEPASAQYGPDYAGATPAAGGAASFHFLSYCLLRQCGLAHELALQTLAAPQVRDRLPCLTGYLALAQSDACLSTSTTPRSRSWEDTAICWTSVWPKPRSSHRRSKRRSASKPTMNPNAQPHSPT